MIIMEAIIEQINQKLDIIIDYFKKEEEIKWKLFEILLEFIKENEPEEFEREALEEVTGERISWEIAKNLIK